MWACVLIFIICKITPFFEDEKSTHPGDVLNKLNESVKILQFDWNRFKERLYYWDPWANRKLFNFIQRQNHFTDYVTKLRMKLTHAPQRVRKINLTIWTGFIRRLVHILVGVGGEGGKGKAGGCCVLLPRVYTFTGAEAPIMIWKKGICPWNLKKYFKKPRLIVQLQIHIPWKFCIKKCLAEYTVNLRIWVN